MCAQLRCINNIVLICCLCWSLFATCPIVKATCNYQFMLFALFLCGPHIDPRGSLFLTFERVSSFPFPHQATSKQLQTSTHIHTTQWRPPRRCVCARRSTSPTSPSAASFPSPRRCVLLSVCGEEEARVSDSEPRVSHDAAPVWRCRRRAATALGRCCSASLCSCSWARR